MSKATTPASLTKQKNDAIAHIDTLLSGLINSPEKHLNKKSSLLSYWLEDFVKYIGTEDAFDPTKLKSYKRGDIVKINFGFNVGSEFGGLHYAIVVNNNNPHNSSVLTVIPLTSQKEGKNLHPNDVDLGNEIYRNLKLKYDTLSQTLQTEKEEILQMKFLINALLDKTKSSISEYDADPESNRDALNDAENYLDIAEQLRDVWEQKELANKTSMKQLSKIGAEIQKMKSGSIALVDQITTVSKMRIFDPRNARGVLAGIRLSPESLDKLNNKIKELFIF